MSTVIAPEFECAEYVTPAPVVFTFAYRVVKRAFDILVAALGLIFLSPAFLVVWILVRLTSPGSGFYAYDETGLGGRQFRCYKFRTMIADADALIPQLSNLNEMKGPVFKMRNDPRITRVGRFLRKYSIDELPQLWCVVWGDMSLVGPRPALPREWEQYEAWQRRRLTVTPGMTGMWQAYGRNQIDDFDKWVRLDLQYIDRWSLWLDAKIIARTVLVVLRGTGI
jgi:lipopolysaccharide/colanic/teichoic acid biosynthesis glycosyltransferase